MRIISVEKRLLRQPFVQRTFYPDKILLQEPCSQRIISTEDFINISLELKEPFTLFIHRENRSPHFLGNHFVRSLILRDPLVELENF